MIAALEVVIQTDNVSVLAHLEHIDFPSLLKYLYLFHVFFLHDLDGDFAPRFLVLAAADEAKLPFSEDLVHLVILVEVGGVSGTLESHQPLSPIILVRKVEEPALLRR